MLSDTTGSWTPVALSADLPAGTVIPARTPAGPIALWRSQSGRVTASADRCPHRGMRLSHGFVRGEALSCIYHGWSYARTGTCLRIPGPSRPHAARNDPLGDASRSKRSDGVIWVAAEQLMAGPPRLEGLVPLRSLVADAGTEAVEAAAKAKAGPEGLVWHAQNAPDDPAVARSARQRPDVDSCPAGR